MLLAVLASLGTYIFYRSSRNKRKKKDYKEHLELIKKHYTNESEIKEASDDIKRILNKRYQYEGEADEPKKRRWKWRWWHVDQADENKDDDTKKK